MSLEISFSCVCLRLGFSNFWLRGLGVSDFVFLANGFDQNPDKTCLFNLIRTIAVFRRTRAQFKVVIA